MSDARELEADDRSHQGMMLSLLKVLVDSQAKQAESHAITLHQIATTQHQMMELLKSSRRSNYKDDDEEKHKAVENPSLSRLNQPAAASLPTLVAPEKHMSASTSDHGTDNSAANTNFSSTSVYEEEIIQVIPSYDLNEQHLQPFEHRQQLQLSDLAGHQTVIDEELPSGEREGQLVWDEYNQLYEAAIAGDWDKASKYLEENPEAITKAITKHPYTVLDVAIIKITDLKDLKFVEEIVKLTPPEALEKITADGVTPLHRAALHGYAKAAELIVNKNPKTTQIVSGNKNVPLENAIQTVTAGQKETVEYLYSVTRHEHPSPFSGHRGAKLLCKAIEAGFNSIALSLVQRFPELVTERTKVNNVCGLELMAERPFAFASGAKLTFWQRCIYSCLFTILINFANIKMLTQNLIPLRVVFHHEPHPPD
ncbi:hypothetical protein MKW94_001915 [Papaver nudicaule]|uniref:Uncharacterized protein n=1 Tax=Papaver nudicaule TaxID=74823 RepID=A0AA41SAT3_PAPNU|nr:hypothetical protein [Papaver nudicaule]